MLRESGSAHMVVAAWFRAGCSGGRDCQIPDMMTVEMSQGWPFVFLKDGWRQGVMREDRQSRFDPAFPDARSL